MSPNILLAARGEVKAASSVMLSYAIRTSIHSDIYLTIMTS
jgi:hypothetical protein